MSYLLTTIGPLIEWVLQPSRLHGTPTKIFIGYLWVNDIKSFIGETDSRRVFGPNLISP